MRKNMKRLICLLVILVLAFAMAGCKKKEDKVKDDKQEVVEDKPVVEDESEESVIPANQNLLTGLADLSEGAIGKRPVAVMINNVNQALPQYGIAQADVIFEMHVEADQTRLMAMYADYTQVPKICAIRSCRYYFPVMAYGFDAFYVNWGFDETIRDYVESFDIEIYDGLINAGKMFGRDKDRLNSGYSLEHTGYFDGTKFADVVKKQGVRVDLKAEKQGAAFLFNGMNEQIKPTGDDCTSIFTEFGAATAGFTYDATSNTYLKQINGKDQMDGKAGTQLAFTNVFILETSVTTRDSEDHKEIDWKGSKNAVGYYVSNGVVQKIHWSKADESSYLKFYDENGEELAINRGKSYIAFNRAGKTTFN